MLYFSSIIPKQQIEFKKFCIIAYTYEWKYE